MAVLPAKENFHERLIYFKISGYVKGDLLSPLRLIIFAGDKLSLPAVLFLITRLRQVAVTAVGDFLTEYSTGFT